VGVFIGVGPSSCPTPLKTLEHPQPKDGGFHATSFLVHGCGFCNNRMLFVVFLMDDGLDAVCV
jgi:hypothetical protein